MTIVSALAYSTHGFRGTVTTHLRPFTRNAPHFCNICSYLKREARCKTHSTSSVDNARRRGRALAVSQLSTETSSSSISSSGAYAYDEINKAAGIVGKYDPSLFESTIYSWWEKSGCFQPDAKYGAQNNDKQPYVIPMPPPNVTGRLHMGHAIFVALQDVLARFHRMRGRPVLWLPGTDHAGIATQLQVEKILLSQGKGVL